MRQSCGRGLLNRPILYAGLVLLFLGGLGVGWLVFWNADERATDGLTREGGLAEGNQANRVQGSEGGPDEPPDRGAAATGTTEETPQGSATGAPAEVSSDQEQAAEPPAGGGSPRRPAPSGFLQTGFGPAAAQSNLAGATRIGEVSVDGDTLTAEYSGGEAVGFDMLFLSVKRTASAADASSEAETLIHSFPVKQLSYTWGGRKIRQAMNDEGRPTQFPPLVCFVWTEGRFAIRVVVAPLAPDRVVDARQSALKFIDALPY
ncbi:MAG: hypothetical protein KGZ40_04030 [Clostridiales bacterium]|nr:hypothetical protein [Clostridiales bacterium]